MSKNTNKFFLRFYNQTDEAIDTCCQRLVEEFSPIKYKRKGKSRLSSNPFGPTPVEVFLYFESKEDMEAFHRNQEAQKLYKEYATGDGIEGNLRLVNPGDPSYGR